MSFVVFDFETTGIDAQKERAIELAAVRIENGQITQRFQQLINPKRLIPFHITQLTGITNTMVLNANAASKVLTDFRHFVGDAILVAHNMAFDEKFLFSECGRSGILPPDNPRICTLKIARRLLPQVPSKGLKKLCDHFGIKITQHHRALADAEATALLFLRFQQFLKNDFGIEHPQDILAFQGKSYADTKGEPAHITAIKQEILPQIPEEAGVYYMKNGRKQVIYVGKAKNLKSRVSSYFNGIYGQSQKTQNLLKEVRKVEWTTVPSELDALLLESKEIKNRLPKFNRASRSYKHIPFLKLDTHHSFPTLNWQYVVRNDGAAYFGPLQNRQQAEQVVELVNRIFKLRECSETTWHTQKACFYHQIHRCHAPCEFEAAKDQYADEVKKVTDFLTGKDDTVFHLLRLAMQEAAQQKQFEEAAWLRDQQENLQRMLNEGNSLAAPISFRNAILVYENEFHVIELGRKTITFINNPTAVIHYLDTHPTIALPDKLEEEALDEIRILSHWLYTHRSEIEILSFEEFRFKMRSHATN